MTGLLNDQLHLCLHDAVVQWFTHLKKPSKRSREEKSRLFEVMLGRAPDRTLGRLMLWSYLEKCSNICINLEIIYRVLEEFKQT